MALNTQRAARVGNRRKLFRLFFRAAVAWNMLNEIIRYRSENLVKTIKYCLSRIYYDGLMFRIWLEREPYECNCQPPADH